MQALTFGMMKFAIFFFYAYSFFVGSYFIQYEKINSQTGVPYTQKDVLSILIALITGFVGLIAALPNVQAIIAAKTLGKLIFDVIERVPEVRDVPNASEKFKLNHYIHFKDVTFKYPTALQEHQPVLQNATFKIKAGDTTAIVGPSGSGKSTIN